MCFWCALNQRNYRSPPVNINEFQMSTEPPPLVSHRPLPPLDMSMISENKGLPSPIAEDNENETSEEGAVPSTTTFEQQQPSNVEQSSNVTSAPGVSRKSFRTRHHSVGGMLYSGSGAGGQPPPPPPVGILRTTQPSASPPSTG